MTGMCTYTLDTCQRVFSPLEKCGDFVAEGWRQQGQIQAKLIVRIDHILKNPLTIIKPISWSNNPRMIDLVNLDFSF